MTIGEQEARAADTPYLMADLDRIDANLMRCQRHLDDHGIRLRPHIKTHKMVWLAERQSELGAVGITCQKIGEAEVTVDGGIDDILITYNLIGAAKHRRLAPLLGKAKITLSADHPDIVSGYAALARQVGRPIEVMVECDTGMGRCGVADPKSAVTLAQIIRNQNGLRYRGLVTYPDTAGSSEDLNRWLEDARTLFAAADIDIGQVSSGGTPNLWRAHEVPGVSEHRPGTYVFMDRSQVARGVCSFDDCALDVVATVVSHPRDRSIVVDAGSKTLTSDLLGLEGHGHIRELPTARIVKLSEEHGVVSLNGEAAPCLGARLRIVPNHVCVCVNMVDRIAFARDGAIQRWASIDARGRSA
ncbi:MAG: D-TA family PLP-dependent enzyme [Geminicoccaceae bacterium]